jgi:hypothetical protein
VANPGRYVAAGSSILLRRSVRNALAPPGASLLAPRDAGRAAAGRAGSFNSGKNAADGPYFQVGGNLLSHFGVLIKNVLKGLVFV